MMLLLLAQGIIRGSDAYAIFVEGAFFERGGSTDRNGLKNIFNCSGIN